MEESKSSWLVPVAIIVCILLIGGAVYFKDKTGAVGGNNASSTGAASQALDKILTLDDGRGGIFDVNQFDLSKLRPVDNTDHILGNPNAPVKIIAYTDLECPACKYYHAQLQGLETKYVATGKLAIVYRAFPLDQIHSKVRAEFLAAECVNELGGNDKYWEFVDKIFEITPSNNGLDPVKLGETAKALGINMKSFDACVAANKYADKIQNSEDEAMALRAPGTPTTFIVDPQGGISPRGFAYQTEALSAAVDLLLTLTPTQTAPAAVAPAATTTGVVAGTSTATN
jgi:protein-disulfide isomerase